ncbi:hypothetical protein DICVIV_04236 [Dictyocaulus viviparus]|uniref:Major facilitator superfamily (MFS) profile domain-containing protein n=1 Tax=Dictyocaulus viviparus TaxID=29172 RepID=A0A0D8Y4X3_DICVI|nr:hypothetical protein DICVIV_04236 [Dictyocaulus viviparus]
MVAVTHDSLDINSARLRNKSLSIRTTQNDSDDERNLYENLDPDKLMNEYGLGRYQFFGYFLCEWINFFYSAAVYVMPYVEANPILKCEYENETIAIDESCWIVQNNNYSLSGKCDSVHGTKLEVRDPEFSTTLILEFGISCSSFLWKEAGLTAFTVGAVFTVPFMSALADEYGRRPIALVAIIVAELDDVPLIGTSFKTYYSLCSILTCELLPSGSRAWITLVQTIAWVFGMFWVGILSLFIKKWRLMYFASASPGILFIVYWLYLPESPYYLIQHGKYKETKNYIEIANRWNNKKVDLNKCVYNGPPPVEEHRETIADMLKSPQMLKLLFINGFIQ